MRSESDQRTWRWIALVATVVNIAFNTFSQRLPFADGTVKEISQRYPSLFTPAGYAFAIWGLIYLATLVYVVYQLSPSQRNLDAHDRLVKPVIAVNVLGMAWLTVFQSGLITFSVAIIALMLATGALLFVRTTGAARQHEISKWVLLPASLWFGWLSVATIANTCLWLVAMGWTDANQVPSTLAGIGIAVLLGLLVGIRYRNWIYPLVIAWAAFAIWLERKSDVQIVALAALLSAALMLAWAVYCAFRAKREKGGLRTLHGPLDAG